MRRLTTQRRIYSFPGECVLGLGRVPGRRLSSTMPGNAVEVRQVDRQIWNSIRRSWSSGTAHAAQFTRPRAGPARWNGAWPMKCNGLTCGRSFDRWPPRTITFLCEWNVHGRRYGSTAPRSSTGQLFQRPERAALCRRVECLFEEGCGVSAATGNTECQAFFYRAPPEYLGCEVWLNSQMGDYPNPESSLRTGGRPLPAGSGQVQHA